MTELARGRVPAAQYLRTSTEDQALSPTNQAHAIRTYAEAHGFEIVRTYQDFGRSGLSVRGRDQLQQLLADTMKPGCPYKAILVYDVSRWGRFQDTDQHAHYEFLCREAGVEVIYCAEPFSNDGSLYAAIAKGLKRAMAAEFSRELGEKLSRGKRKAAQLGRWIGGRAPYAFRRRVVDSNGVRGEFLEPGQRCTAGNYHVVLDFGPAEEVRTVRTIFTLCARDGLSPTQIAAHLARNGAPAPGKAWTAELISSALRNEIYIGVCITNKRSARLGPSKREPKARWVRVQVAPPMVSPRIFRQAQRRLQGMRGLRFSDEFMISALRRLAARHGQLSADLIRSLPGGPGPSQYRKRFGALRRAYELAGWREGGRRWTNEQILRSLRRLRERNGPFNMLDLDREPGAPNSRTVRTRFGSIDRALLAAGLPSQAEMRQEAGEARRQNGYSPERLRAPANPELLVQLKAAFERHGRLSWHIIDKDPALPSGVTFARRFGSIFAAYELVGFRMNRLEALQESARRAREKRRLLLEARKAQAMADATPFPGGGLRDGGNPPPAVFHHPGRGRASRGSRPATS